MEEVLEEGHLYRASFTNFLNLSTCSHFLLAILLLLSNSAKCLLSIVFTNPAHWVFFWSPKLCDVVAEYPHIFSHPTQTTSPFLLHQQQMPKVFLQRFPVLQDRKFMLTKSKFAHMIRRDQPRFLSLSSKRFP